MTTKWEASMNGGTEPRLPYWPAALDHKMAASYCGLAGDVFKAICPVQPIKFPGRTIEHRYLRHRLDEWLSAVEANKESVKAASPAPGDEKRAFSPKRLAARWDCSERHIRNMIKRGDIPAFGKLLRVSWEDVDRFESGQTQSGSDDER